MAHAIQLHAGVASATILPARGALVTDLKLAAKRQASGRARAVLWMPSDFNADESGWPGGGLPLCFPFAGRVFHEGRPFEYEIGGAVRPMAIHGFAYGMPWSVV